MKKQSTIYWGMILLLIGFMSCGKEAIPVITPPTIEPETGVFIGNEGGFGFNNASLSFYQFKEQTVSQELFKNANNRALGDVLQSMTLHEAKLYLVMNNSNKIEVVDPENFQSLSTIGTFTSPRFLLPVGNNKAYLSDLYEDVIYVIDLSTETLSSSIPLKGWTEEMIQYQEKVFVSNRESKYVYVIDSNTDQLIDSIATAYNSSNLLLDKNNQIWVFCSGQESNNEKGGLFVINPTDLSVTKKLLFADYDIGAWPRMAINASLDTIYYLKNDLYQIPIQNNSLVQNPLVNRVDRVFYSIGVQASTGHIFLGDAIDYQQRGWILQYSSKGELLNSFQAGVIPNSFLFY